MKTLRLTGVPGSGKTLALTAISDVLVSQGKQVISFQGNSTVRGILQAVKYRPIDAVLIDEMDEPRLEEIQSVLDGRVEFLYVAITV